MNEQKLLLSFSADEIVSSRRNTWTWRRSTTIKKSRVRNDNWQLTSATETRKWHYKFNENETLRHAGLFFCLQKKWIWWEVNFHLFLCFFFIYFRLGENGTVGIVKGCAVIIIIFACVIIPLDIVPSQSPPSSLLSPPSIQIKWVSKQLNAIGILPLRHIQEQQKLG